MGWYYRIFNLVVHSCVELLEAVEVTKPNNIDVSVNFGSVDIDKEHIDRFFIVKINSKRIVINTSAAIFEVCDGNRITIELKEGYDDRLLRIFLLGSALGAIQYQLGYLPLHGGAIVAGGKAVIITGNAGAGKSTMTSTLVGMGYKYLTDDVSCVCTEDTLPIVFPSYPQRKLIRDACIRLGYDPETLPVADKDRDKFAIRDPQRWHETPAPLGMILELVRAEKGKPLSVTDLPAIERIRVIRECLYRPVYHMDNCVIPPAEIKRLFGVASKIKMFTVSVPGDIENIEAFAKNMAELLNFDKQ